MQEKFSNEENRTLEIAATVCERSFGTGGFSKEYCFKRPLDHILFRLVCFCHLHDGFATKHSLLSTVDIADVLLTDSDECQSESGVIIGQ